MRRSERSRSARAAAPVSRLRQQIAQAAARILASDQALSHGVARDKAVRAVGGTVRRQDIPELLEIDAEFAAYQRLFRPLESGAWLRAQRRAAVSAMDYFAAFSPRLCGAVLRGASSAESPVVLHLYAEPEDQVVLHLINENVPYRLGERRYLWPDGRERVVPVVSMDAGGQSFELVVFASREISRPPLSKLTGRPYERANRAQVEALLAATSPPDATDQAE